MANFEPRHEDELSKLNDEKLLEYIALARARGTAAHVQTALAVIVFRHYDDIVRRIKIKVPPSDVDDVAQEVVVSAIRSKLDGKSVGEFRTWLNTIISRRIADYHRKPGVDTTELPEEHTDDEDIWGEVPGTDPETGAIEVQEIIDIAKAELSDRHRLVVDLFIFEDLTGQDTTDQVNEEFPNEEPTMKVDNVAKIVERFRERVRELLQEAEQLGDEEDPDDEDPDNPQ